MADQIEQQNSGRWVRWALIVSLAVNLLVIGMVGGAVLSGGGPGDGDRAARENRGSPFVRALEPGDRRAVMRGMIKERRQLRESREVLKARFDALLTALRAEEFDVDAARALVEQQRKATQDRVIVGETVVLTRIAEMSLEDRRAYADRLEAEVRRPRRR